MFNFLPVLFLLLLAVVIFALHWSEQGKRFAWLISVIGLFLAWLGVFALRWFRPAEVVFPAWRPFEPLTADRIVFDWETNAWVLAICLVGLLLAVILTAPVRFQYNSNPLSWSAAMTFTAIGLLSILSGSPLALAISWTLLDVVEVVYVLLIIRDYRYRREVLTSFALRLFSVGLLLSVMIVARQPGLGYTFESTLERDALWLIGAVILRLGVLPLSLKYEKQLPLQNGLTSLMRITGQISGLALLAKLPAGLVVSTSYPLVVGGIVLLMLYAAVMWILAENEIAGRTFFGLFFSGLAILSVLQGNAPLSVVWGVALVCWGGFIFLCTVRSPRLMILTGAVLFSFCGAPFTILSAGWQAVAVNPGWVILLAILWVVVIAGFIRHALQPRESSRSFEPYIVTTYTLGLMVLLISGWLSVFLGVEQGLRLGTWWGGIIVLGLTVFLGQSAYRRKQVEGDSSPQMVWLQPLIQKATDAISAFLRLNWLYLTLRFVFHAAQGVTRLLTVLFEGEGGVLWSLLLLVLVISIIGGVR
ncbi:hypothetical protein BECAL_02614 [Bellilinea caldifistulae]|uniref:NADH:quinone oxidoreductase/Mrp antiporter membrane subunit domain-containing protein n=1 Tax=Bellilinea caldifistulae TaxID=360411 RepID=A0A0P6XJI4_9CHLR|nr:hypothetical protein [Bellilinea caldifistulae]KPL75873.1 hypothetical protein AC812_07820 [Bellilinea caldifistulae]GAP11426.1 hypothetical protein BECAL_02614 [Bellilinea caldifistulae]